MFYAEVVFTHYFYIHSVIFLVVGIFFAVRNPQLITLDFILWQSPEFSISLYLLLSFAFGAFVAIIASSVVLVRAETDVRVLRKRCTLIQKNWIYYAKPHLPKI